jgi:hypothetical protein
MRPWALILGWIQLAPRGHGVLAVDVTLDNAGRKAHAAFFFDRGANGRLLALMH